MLAIQRHCPKPRFEPQVEYLRDQIDPPVAKAQIEFEPWVFASKSKEDRGYAVAAEQRPACDTRNLPMTSRLPEFEKRLASPKFLDRTQAPLIILLAVLRQILCACRSIEQADAKAIFQSSDGFPDGRASERKPFSSLRKTASFDGFDEDLHPVKSVAHRAIAAKNVRRL